MKTIADVYMDEGVEKGIAQGIKIGETKGEHKKAVIIAKKMFTQGFKVSVIAELTGLKETLIRSIIESN